MYLIPAEKVKQLCDHVESWKPVPELENALCDWLDQLREDPENAIIYGVDWCDEQYVYDHETEELYFRARLSIRTLNEKTGARQAEGIYVRITHDAFYNDGSEGWE